MENYLRKCGQSPVAYFTFGFAACLVLLAGCTRASFSKVGGADAGDAASLKGDGPRADATDARADALTSPSCLPDAGKGSKDKAEACACNNDCRSGFCVGGVCCDSACTDGCKACNLPSALGTCTLVPAGGTPSDPNFCAASTPASCGLDGTCDGSGGCRKYVNGILCKNGTCDGDGVIGAKACDGKGACSITVDTPCAPYTCDPKTNQCAETCTSNADCSSQQTCSGHRCGFKLNGAKCADDGDCASGHCTDQRCCNVACSGACMTCNDPSAPGRCKLIGQGLRDSRCVASAAATCGTTGLCDGAGACALFPENTMCSAATCAASVTENTARVCDGQGTCRDAQVVDCAPFLCSNGACSSSCLKDSDCESGHQCVATAVNGTTTGRCGKVAPGAPCTAASDCQSNFCVDGVCCQTACDGACRSCNLPGSPGQCGNIPKGSADPRNGCKDLGKESCGTNGLCDGVGGCQVYPTGTSCGTESCVEGAYTPAATCSSAGQCVTPASVTCNPYICNGSKCFAACSNDNQCVPGNVCAGGSCGLKPPGAQCSSAKECKSNHCAQGVCCDSDCTAACMTCTLTASMGKCTAVADGTVDPQEQCKVTAQNSCGTTGACKGGQCAFWAKGSNCASAVCASSTSATPASTCDGAGKCSTPSTIDCGNFICSSTTKACLNACTSNIDCRPPNTCANGSCGLISNGNPCSSGEQCASGFCTEGVCCDSACNDGTGGLCKSCKVAGNVGKCSFVPSGTDDPKHSCSAGKTDPLGKQDCSNDGTCNGNGACRPWLAIMPCRHASCPFPGSAYTPSANCNGAGKCCDSSGNCPPSTVAQSCSPYTCDSVLQASCLTTCSKDADCVSGETCRKVDNKCGNKLPLGQACGAATDCGSGYCVDSTCCGATTCNDNLACTTDSCATSDGSCKHTLNSGYCLIAGVCYAEGTTNPTNPCQVCTSAKSTSAWSAKADGTTCDDGSVCTTGDSCSNGSCVGTGSLNCNDSNVCTTDSCDPKTGCAHTNNTLSCNDSNACTKNDVCSGGTCAGTAYSCDDGLTCTTDTCVGDGTCTHTTAATSCVIGNACYAAGAVNPANPCAVCTPTTSQTAWSPNTATGVVCRAVAGDCDTPEVCDGLTTTCPADAVKSQGTQCRAAADLCDTPATCSGSSATCPANGYKQAGTQCRAAADLCDTPATCSGSSATCPANGFISQGTQCRAAADLCDTAATCSGTSATCPANGFKTLGTLCRASTGVCDPAENCTGTTAACPTNVFLADLTPCSDDACLNGKTCSSGKCTGGTAIVCNDSNACTTDTCNPATGCVYTPIVCTGTCDPILGCQ